MLVEAELCAAASEILQKLGFDDFIIRINHREILRGMLNAVGIADEKQADALVAIDKLDKIGKDGVLKEFAGRETSEQAGIKLLDLFARLAAIGNINTISTLSEFIGEDEEARAGLDDLKQILEFTNLENIKIDASLARGLSYYTGAIFEINVPDLAGSLGGGGRYDALIGMFGKEEIPACGFSLGLERIVFVMDERNMFPADLQNSSADVLVTIWNKETIAESVQLANDLRSQGLRVLLYPEADKLGKQFKYADSINVPFVCILGETELTTNKVTLKNMETGEQETIERGQASEKIKK